MTDKHLVAVHYNNSVVSTTTRHAAGTVRLPFNANKQSKLKQIAIYLGKLSDDKRTFQSS